MRVNKIAVSGSTGFVGKILIQWLFEKNYEVISLGRDDFSRGPGWIAEKISGCDAIIHLAGSPVIKRWTGKTRNEIINSRIITTDILIAAFSEMQQKPGLFICASAIGIYSNRNVHSEESSDFGQDFLAKVVKDWEKAATKAGKWVNRIVLLRIGIVLSFKGGAAAKVKNLFRFGLGGYLGSGKQKMSFIHITDLCRMIEFIIENHQVAGVVNCVAPQVTFNREYSKELTRLFGWKHIFAVPSFVLRIRFGRAADLVLKGQHVLPEKIQKAGFVYNYPDIRTAIKSLLNE